ncbi:MAG TPA: hypothetical protein VM733_03165 [Thermoanaerobaculia bacterium]|nr:hypothetical protein [Thermoanaerobaculia bacterium]
MSRAGFSTDGAFAVIYLDFDCALCGYGTYTVLRRENGHRVAVADVINRVS